MRRYQIFYEFIKFIKIDAFEKRIKMTMGKSVVVDTVHIKYLIGEKAFRAATINFFINGSITYFSFHGIESIPMWGVKCISNDIFVSLFIVTLIISLITTALTLKKVNGGHIQKPNWRRSSHPILKKLPRRTFARSVVLAFAVVFLFAPAAILILRAMNITEMHFGVYVIFKACLTALLAAFVSPVAALCVLGDA